jgi:hypothetical protein
MFGLIDTGQGRATLTELGREALDGSGAGRAARVQAFLNPELFNRMYEQNRGHILPPPAAIERQMEQMGISPKQKERARQTFSKSATYAGFIDTTTGRFVKPGNLGITREESPPVHQERERDFGGGGDSGDGLNLDPLLIALLKKIPDADKGWPASQRLRWFRTFAMNVSQIYDGDDGAPVEMKIDLDKSTD